MAHLDFLRTTGGSRAATIACAGQEAREEEDKTGQTRMIRFHQAQDLLRKMPLTSSKTFLSPFCVKAEHSTYLTAPNSRARRSPASNVTGLCF